MKTKNSETSGCNPWESVVPKLSAFMEKGGCIEPLWDYIDCKREAEKMDEDVFTKCKEVKDRLYNCVIAHRDYHQPIIDIVAPTVELVVDKIEALLTPEKLVDTVSTESTDQPKEGHDPLQVFVTGGACGESYMALEDCVVGIAEGTSVDISRCTNSYTMLIKCMDAHSDYYQPILDVVHYGEDYFRAALVSTMRCDSERI